MKENISKSNVMAFNSKKDIELLLYNGCILQEVDKFKYLGMTFNRTVNLKYSQKALVQQSIEARAVLEGYLRKHRHMPVNMIFDLFDTLIKPILLYACEVWGINMSNNIDFLEQLDLSFIKTVLGVKPSNITCLIYTVTRRFPLYVCIYKQILKYWLKLTCTSEHRFLVIAYHENPSEWSLFVEKLLYENGFGDVWETDAKYVNHSLFIQQFEQSLW